MRSALASILIIFSLVAAHAQLGPQAAPVPAIGPTIGGSSLPPAGSNLNFFVAAAGSSDGNPCTSLKPCASIQHAATLAAQFNYQGLYFPTLSVANGTYSEQVILPVLTNVTATNGAVIALGTNVIVNDKGTSWTFTLPPYSNWTFTGTLTLGGTYGGIAINGFAGLTLPPTLTFSGTLVNGGITLGPAAVVGAKNSAINTTTASMGTLFFTRGTLELDGATVTFTNAISFPSNNYVVGIDSPYGFFAFSGGSFVNPANVTATAPLQMNNGALFEINSSTLSGGAALQRSNFPGVSNGGTVVVDASSIFMGDIITAGNFEIDNTNFFISSNGTGSVGFGVKNTSVGGHQLFIGEVGSAGVFGQPVGGGSSIDLTNGNFIEAWDTSGNVQYTGALKWSAQTAYTFNAADTSLSRLSAAVLAVGNGTAADTSGTIEAAHATLTTLANTATTSAVCYNTGTGVLTYDGTIGTCTVSDERLKNIGPRIDDALDKLLSINGFYFTFKDGKKYGYGRQLGVGAQTVEKVFPELVSTDADGTKIVDYQKLAAPIIEAMRELKGENDKMRACLSSWRCRLFGM